MLFTDLVSSTQLAAEMGDRRWRELLDAHDQLTGELISRFRGRLIDRTGDGLIATFDGPARAVRAATAICDEVRRLGVEVRVGLHAGESVRRGDNVGGIAVHLAARVMSTAGGGEVVVSRTVKDLTAGSGLMFTDRGTHQLKGIPEECSSSPSSNRAEWPAGMNAKQTPAGAPPRAPFRWVIDACHASITGVVTDSSGIEPNAGSSSDPMIDR